MSSWLSSVLLLSVRSAARSPHPRPWPHPRPPCCPPHPHPAYGTCGDPPGRAGLLTPSSPSMAAKRRREGMSPAHPPREKKVRGAPNTPPTTPPDNSLGDFYFIDTRPSRVRLDLPRTMPEVEVVEVPPSPHRAHTTHRRRRRHRGSDTEDITVLFEGPTQGQGQGGARAHRGALVRQCHTRATPSSLTHAQAEEEEEVEVVELSGEEDTVEVVELPTRQDNEVEVVEVAGEAEDMEEGEEQRGHTLEGTAAPPTTPREEVVQPGGREEGPGTELELEPGPESELEPEPGPALESRQEDEGGHGGDFVSLGGSEALHSATLPLPGGVMGERRALERLRYWEAVSPRQGGGMALTVVSYNVLAQSLLRANPYLYRDCCPAHLSWAHRWAVLQHEVVQLAPDVLLLQEVEGAHYHTHYLPWLASQGYQGIFKQRTGDKVDGCAIFFLTNRLVLQEKLSVEFYQPTAPEVLDRDNVALMARLAPRRDPSGPSLCVATTHLLYNPRRHDVKLAQTAVLLAELDRLCYLGQAPGGQPRYCPVVLAGDLNAQPHTALLSFLQEGRLRYEGLARRTLTRYGTTGPELGTQLLPPALGVTAACQHACLAQGRYLMGQRGPILPLKDRRNLEEALIRLQHSSRPSLARCTPSRPALGPTQHGWLSHAFPLLSVYQQQLQHRGGAPRPPGVTTFQDGWCVVDYLMYSAAKHPKGDEGSLTLLARLRLLSGAQATKFAPMPSAACPSDHFPLGAKFLLQR